MKKTKFILGTALFSSFSMMANTHPNIIFILADDLGIGDISALNSNSKIKTPNIDRLAANGIAFNDAHSSSSVSTPTRYGILTGRYNWRSTLKQGVLSGYSKPLIPQERTTMASLLKRANYTTGCIGKWHLGWDWNYTTESNDLDNMSAQNQGEIDFTKPIQNGPTSLGFDYFYGFSGSLDMPPYVYVENDQTTALPDQITENTGMKFWRKGPTGSDFIHEDVLGNFTNKAIEFIYKNNSTTTPFFLYLPIPAPHTPILPTHEWEGRSKLNPYGDFVMMVDYEVGRIIDLVEKLGIAENTLIVFTSDNGCSPQANFDELAAKKHFPSKQFRGYKADLFEGGHRIPCIVQWKNKINQGVCDQTICLTDFFASFAEITGLKLNDNEGEDSFSLLHYLKKNDKNNITRQTTVHHSITGEFAIRKGEWKLLVSPSSGGWSYPRPSDTEVISKLPIMQLYNLKSDPYEKSNLFVQESKKANELLKDLRILISNGRSTPGYPQSNDSNTWKQLERIFY